MPTISNIRGMLLEEALLHLLRATGYRTVDSAVGDNTLNLGSSGLEVRGRGHNHQIDAIADFQVPHPFSYPQRLLVEAKCLAPGKAVGIEVARNAIGVIKDANEFWISNGVSPIPKARYHYQYALFSATGYTIPTQRYAFAQDVYLIPVNSTFMISIISAIRAVTAADFGVAPAATIPISLTEMREIVRRELRFRSTNVVPNFSGELLQKLDALSLEASQLGYCLLSVLGGRFPVFLAPRRGLRLESLPDLNLVRIRWDHRSWYLDSRSDERLFSFDLPPELFELFATNGILRPSQAIDLKQEMLSSFYAFFTMEERVRVIRFELDAEWLATIRDELRSRRQALIEN